jgi:hypothetical protein
MEHGRRDRRVWGVCVYTSRSCGSALRGSSEPVVGRNGRLLSTKISKEHGCYLLAPCFPPPTAWRHPQIHSAEHASKVAAIAESAHHDKKRLVLAPTSLLDPRSSMSLQSPIPVPPDQATDPRASDGTTCGEPTGLCSTQKDAEGGTEKAVDVSEVVSSEDAFPDGGLRAWAVVLGVRPGLSLQGSS